MKYTLIIVTHKRLPMLQECLKSIQDQLPKPSQIIVILNGHDPESYAFLSNNDLIEFMAVERMTPAQARNTALQRVKGEWVGFLDDDIKVPNHYYETLEKILNEQDCDVLGGPDATFPNAGPWEQSIGLALKSPLSTSKTRFRHNNKLKVLTNVDESSLILCNLWIKRNVLGDKPFPENFWRNEENVMLHYLGLQQIKMIWSPELFVYHKRKGNFLSLYRAVSSSGENRLRSFILQPDSLDFRFFVPSIFTLYLLLFPILFSINSNFVLFAILYLIINLTTSIYYGKTLWARVSLIQFMINISYGLGMWRGLIARQVQ